MFWSGNYIAVRELNFLLKEEDVSLTQVLEADDILQECKADNKALIQFLTKPEVLAELITLITEEPPKNIGLTLQYRHASIACEVLTSHLSTLADRLSLDTVQMNRLCDFVNKEPPLNPLLASYFSKTVEMLLERSPKQDWYLYHIVCLRVLDFLRSRRDLLPNLLRHMATSAVADTFKYLLRLDDLFHKIVMEWLDEHQFLESLIQIICGSYVPEPIRPHPAAAPSAPNHAPSDAPAAPGEVEKAAEELSEKNELNHKEENSDEKAVTNSDPAEPSSDLNRPTGAKRYHADDAHIEHAISATRSDVGERWRAVAAANAAELLCDLVLNGYNGEGCAARPRTVSVLVSRLQSEQFVRALLAGMFTSPGGARAQAIVHGSLLLLALLCAGTDESGGGGGERTSVELAVAPHLPLLHQALLQPPHAHTHDGGGRASCEGGERCERGERSEGGAVGAARVHVAGLLAQLARSEVQDVPTTMITLGTPGTLVDLFFLHPANNFLHAQVYMLLKHALSNRAYCTQYANHLLVECDLLTRLMDVLEENENKRPGVPRAGYMGHVVQMLRRIALALEEQDGALREQLRLSDALLTRWSAFQHKLDALLRQRDTPLGGYYPSENSYTVDPVTELNNALKANFEFSSDADLGDDGNIDTGHEFADQEDGDGQTLYEMRQNFSKIMSEKQDGDDMWDDAPEEDDDFHSAGADDAQFVLAAASPWECSSSEVAPSNADDDWAQFTSAPAPPPIDPFAPHPPLPAQDFPPLWPDTNDIPTDIMRLSQFSISATFPDQIEPATLTSGGSYDKSTDNSLALEPSDVTLTAVTNKLDVDNDNTINVNDNANVKDALNVNADFGNVNTDAVKFNADCDNVNTDSVKTKADCDNVNTDSVKTKADCDNVNTDSVKDGDNVKVLVPVDDVNKDISEAGKCETSNDATEPEGRTDS